MEKKESFHFFNSSSPGQTAKFCKEQDFCTVLNFNKVDEIECGENICISYFLNVVSIHVFMFSFICHPSNFSIQPSSISLFLCRSICPSIHLCTCLLINSFVHPLSHFFFHQSCTTSIHPLSGFADLMCFKFLSLLYFSFKMAFEGLKTQESKSGKVYNVDI